ncbi:MAG: tRNA 2-selenouridine(34) synthase MnmH [Verrucomicrobiales bacterium]
MRLIHDIAPPIPPGDFDEIIDVRSPVEYAEDRVPGAINLPVLSDAERAAVGTLHRQSGEFQARRMGAAIIARNIGAHLESHFAGKPRGYRPLIYCWRGGQRSRSLATILSAVGWSCTLIAGGYKAHRTYVRRRLMALPPAISFRVLAGLTGSGKTRILAAVAARGGQVLDLEALANHRGSLLGSEIPGGGEPQPSQKGFETRLWAALEAFDPARPVFAEAESRKVGNVSLPTPLWGRLIAAPTCDIAAAAPARARFLLREYGYLTDQPDYLLEKVEALKAHCGSALVGDWRAQIEAGRWEEFVASILEHHYDRSYAKNRAYLPAEATIDAGDLSDEAIGAAAAEILAQFSGGYPERPCQPL